MARLSRTERLEIAKRRLIRILTVRIISTSRNLEHKISDAGPGDLRVDPHVLTQARKILEKTGEINSQITHGIPWYYLAKTPEQELNQRLQELLPIFDSISNHAFVLRLGQTLEIAVFKALMKGNLQFLGNFPDLDLHDDSTLYKKEEPPSSFSGKSFTGKLDFMIIGEDGKPGGIEVKNVREWLYPDRDELRELFQKCCSIDAVPVLIARRIPFVTFRLLNPCGVIVHQNYNQLYPNTNSDLAKKARHKDLLGYHDIRIGNEPDKRLTRFICNNLPALLPKMRENFNRFKDLLYAYSTGEMEYAEFAGRVIRRQHGESEDFAHYAEQMENFLDEEDFQE